MDEARAKVYILLLLFHFPHWMLIVLLLIKKCFSFAAIGDPGSSVLSSHKKLCGVLSYKSLGNGIFNLPSIYRCINR